MRTLTDHQVNPANDTLTIAVMDEPGSGGANHRYLINGFDYASNPGATDHEKQMEDSALILFQNGPINEVGVNGITHEALLAILCDRMRGFQAGPYASADNAEALDHMMAAQTALQRRTLARMARGVEGTHTV
jgi:serine/threonine protein phosphatase PrpC